MAENITSFRMYLATCTGNAQNTIYSIPFDISNAEELAAACRKDHVCTEFKDSRRGSDNFIRCHAIQADCDNDSTDDPAAWITPAIVAARLPGIAFYAVKSRNCDKVKHPGKTGEKSARPRWHYYFPLRVAIPDIHIIREIMARLLIMFPEFDRDGMKPAQFFFGHTEPLAEYHPGKNDVAEYLIEHPEIITLKKKESSDPKKARAAAPADNDEDDLLLANLPEMLSYFNVDDYDDWSFIGICLKAAGEKYYDHWDKWSSTSKKYPGSAEARRKWDHDFKANGKTGPGSLFHEAEKRGWQQQHFTGEYKANHEARIMREAHEKRVEEGYKEKQIAALAAIGIDCAGDPGRFTWELNYDGSIAEVFDKETGEIIYQNQQADIIGNVLPANHPDAEARSKAMPDPAAPWEPIIKGNALPAFPLDSLPGWIQDYIVNFSENTGINKDFCAACVLGAVSTVICGHLDIHFNGTHYEPAQLYIVFVGRSGSMKSTAVKQFHGPAKAWMMEKNKTAKDSNQSICAEIDSLSDELMKAQRKKSGLDEIRISEIKSRIEAKRESKNVLYPVPFTDINPESTIKSMAETNGAATIAAPEGNLINVLTGRSSYTQRGATPNLDIFLAGYDGEPYHGIRVTSGEVAIPRADISILMAIQPTLLETLCRSSDANGRGLVQRFLIFAPENPETAIDHTKPNTTDQQFAARWNEHIRTIAERFMEPGKSPVIMELFSEADTIIRELWNYEAELIRKRGQADEEGITGWISKLHGKGLRLAAILAVLDEPKAINITRKHAETAARLLKEYFIPHYIGSYETAENLSQGEKKIISWIIRHAESTGERESFMERDLKQHLRNNSYYTGRYGAERFRSVMEGLQDKNYIRPLAMSSGRGRPSVIWQINPELFTD